MKNCNDILKTLLNETNIKDYNSLKSIISAELYLNGQKHENILENVSEEDDAYYLLYNSNFARVISLANGYALSLPTTTSLNLNLFSTIYRVQYSTNDYVLTVSQESSNTYSNWKVYHDEWVVRYLTTDGTPEGDKNIEQFFKANNLSYTIKPFKTLDMLEGYEVEIISVVINDNENIEKPYYNIAIIRRPDERAKFTLFVMKSKNDMANQFDEIVCSLKLFSAKGKLRKPGKFELNIPSYLSEETKRYYKKLINQNYTEWGIFIHSMQVNGSNTDRIRTKTKIFESKEQMDYTFEIMPTYTHCGNYQNPTSFPTDTANELAGGNGFNGKPVLQFTLQFTTSNNLSLHDYTPMYDIIRGKYDDYFKVLAKDIKAYGKPVLFRLNNEMNSDWVSYCGQVTLLDPDIFVMTWERMAKILKEEGCDNILYIFNPTGKTYPYCSWGEDLCYLPSLEFVQILGLTYYEYNNYLEGEDPISFESLYNKWLYEKNSPQWIDYPAIISEFACGAGGAYPEGELYRNNLTQAKWVKDMFYYLNANRDKYPFAKQIKAAIWFNADDWYSTFIKNLLVLDLEKNKETIKELKNGLAENKTLKK